MDKLKRQRGAVQARIDALRLAVDQHTVTPFNEAQIEEYLQRIDNIVKKYDTIHDGILAICPDADIPTHQTFYDHDELRLSNIRIELAVISKAKTPAPNALLDLKLPSLDLPVFEGEIRKWPEFQDMFMAAVHSKPGLPDVQKLQFLKKSLKGEPAALLQNIPLTDVNYLQAWNTLKNRYDDKKEMIKSILDRLFSLQNLKQEDPASLRKIGDVVEECVGALELLKLTHEETRDLLFIHLISRKLDHETRVLWETSLPPNTLPKVKQFTEFVLNRARAIAAAGIKAKPVSSAKPVEKITEKKQAVYHGTTSKPNKCLLCENNSHYLNQCEKYLKMNISERKELLRKSGACYNCLIKGHLLTDCTSTWKCKKCNESHHTTIHIDKEKVKSEDKPKEPEESEQKTEQKTHLSTLLGKGLKGQTLLSTALIKVVNNGKEFIVRALLDNGSDVSFITRRCATLLGLKRHSVKLPIAGLGKTEIGTMNDGVELEFSSTYKSKPTFLVEAFIMKTITGIIPSQEITNGGWNHLKGLQLADPRFNEPGNIDVLLGGDIYDDILKSKRLDGPRGSPTARDSHLGWVLSGKLKPEVQIQKLRIHHAKCELDENLQKFWNVEEIQDVNLNTKEENECEKHFAENHRQDEDGRFYVKLPFKSNAKELGESKTRAENRWMSMERCLSKSPETSKEYFAVLDEYLQLNHMEKIPISELKTENPKFYIPHHVVVKPSSTTTKYRVVFDASAKTSTGVSLNDNLMVGPKIQDDLVNILIRFRENPIAFTADIAKMYRQVRIEKEDVDFQRIVWRKKKSDPIEEYRLLTATFGTASAPYQSVKCVHQLARNEMERLPDAAAVVLRDFYVDDLMTGSKSVNEALKLQKNLISLLKIGKFELRKWSSNKSELLESLEPDLRETKSLEIDLDSSVKTLGLSWNPNTDEFSFKVNLAENVSDTKRKVLSEIAKIFDPLGWLAPVTVKAKVLMQRFWQEDLDWDEPLTDDLMEIWIKYRNELPELENLRIPRCATFWFENISYKYYLTCFSDASEQAYGAMIYLMTIDMNNDTRMIRLIAAKTKVAPIKQISIARLELCGAVLLVRLLENVRKSLTLEIEDSLAWTDSTIVLSWLSSEPRTWQTFVANRVSRIQRTLPRNKWRHVKGLENPADCASRGISPMELKDFALWWNGPEWLATMDMNEETMPVSESFHVQQLPEAIQTKEPEVKKRKDRFHNHSSLGKLQQGILKLKRRLNKKTGLYSVDEWEESLRIAVKLVQLDEFESEISALKKLPTKDEKVKRKVDQIMKKSKIRRLNPFLDRNGILRVGGRLMNADVSDDLKNPMLLPKAHHLTKLIIQKYHETLLHGGSLLLLSNLQERFWIPSGREVVKKIIRGCVRCARFRAETAQQIMGSLPKARVNPSRPFQHTGVDLAGPFTLKNCKGRKTINYKGYVEVFICLATRAIHLDMVSDMTTESFLQTFARFVATRGKPLEVYSDCGTNFVGADNELKLYLKMLDQEETREDIRKYTARQGINWRFNVPSAPHHGGLWEAGVKSMKFHLRRVVGDSILNFEEMTTILKKIEACLNSRPLSALSTDPSDLQALTPGHFLIGTSLTAVPEPDLTGEKMNRLTRWQLTQQMFQHFWNRWSSEHLTRLRQPPKWLSKKRNLEVGDLVLIKDEREPPLKWKMGRILELYPGPDEEVRVVKLKTESGELKRPIVKLCPLPIEDSLDSGN